MKPLITFLLLSLPMSQLQAQSWPTHRKDFGRTGYVNAEVDPGRLQQIWAWKDSASPAPPEPAWDGPARWDAFAELKDLPAMRQYDACFHPVSDGKVLVFGSSSQDAVYGLDLATGKQKWVFVSGGPIRIAPTIEQDKVLFGSDDGFAYCLNKSDGSLIWKFNPSATSRAEQRHVLSNDRLISFYPIRTGVAVRDGIAYFAASFLPWRESYLCGLNIKTGKPDIPNATFVTKHVKATLEGPLLIAEDKLIVPQGRIAPLLFDRSSGNRLSTLPGGGGVTIVLTEEGGVARAEGGRAARPGQVGVFKGKERVASFARGRSIVVRPDAYFVIDRQKVFGVSRKANELLWQSDLEEPLEIIMVGKYLIVGGRDQVTVFDSESGQRVWQAKVDGRVFGLAYAGNKLIASTDKGNVLVFAANASQTWKPKITQSKPSRQLISIPKSQFNDNELIHRWVFHRSEMTGPREQSVTKDSLQNIKVKDQKGNAALTLIGTAKSSAVGQSSKVEAIELNKAMFPIDEKIAKDLPASQITVESWVRVDQSKTWGGIVGCIQDDGSTEHGWLLGFNGDHFSFAVAGSKSGLTYLKAAQTFTKGRWYHVAGTYDGNEMKLYVNGELSASSNAEQGPISYAKKLYFTVGAYKDANESFPLDGALHEVRIHKSVLNAKEISRNHDQLKAEFKTADTNSKKSAPSFLSWGPYVRFVAPGRAEISYGTIKPCQSVVEIDLLDGGSDSLVFDASKKTDHRVTVSDLPTKRLATYRIKTSKDKKQALISEAFQLDTHFDWSVKSSQVKADPVLEGLPNPRGIAFVFGKDNVKDAIRIAKSSNLTVVYFPDDEGEGTVLRQRWINDRTIQYGKQLSVSLVRPANLPAATAQIVMIQQSIKPDDISQFSRLVRPSGGVLANGKEVLWTRGKVAGAGEWTHMYGLANNSAFGGEELGDASNREDLVANWIGKPGPRYQTDRQNRKPSPLAANGRLYLQGQQRMIAMDSYSGSILWSVEAPTVMRWNVPRDSSNWCADDSGVYVASQKEAWFISGSTGKIKKRFGLPPEATKLFSEDDSAYWGYIARHQQLLLGTAVQSDAIYTKWWGKTQWFDTPTGADTHLVAGDNLFAMDHQSGKLRWSYEGLVLHPTITILGERIYFIEDKTADHKSGRSRRISLDKKQQHELVALNLADGKEVFRKPIAPFQGKVAALYLAGGGASKLSSLILSASESTQGDFVVTCYRPDNGTEKWKRRVKWEANHHGKHISRPAIENDIVYLRPEVLKLVDGTTIKRGFPSGHGCSSYALSKNGLFSRLGETTWWDVRNDKVNRFERVRTDCWISAIPAQGMLLSAEGGGGCSCGSWLETSIGFLPRKIDQAIPSIPTK